MALSKKIPLHYFFVTIFFDYSGVVWYNIKDMPQAKAERREYHRLEISIPVHYLLPKPGKPVEISASTRDIGGGGICLESEGPVSLRSPLEIQIKLPTGTHPIAIHGKVVWCKKTSSSVNKYRVGIAFHGVNEEDRREIIGYIEKILR